MNKHYKPIGLKENLDKVLFILAIGYLIAIAAWLIRQEKVKSSLSLNNSTEDLPSLENKSNQEPETETPLKLSAEVAEKTTSAESLSSITNQSLPQPSNLTTTSRSDRQISNSPPLLPLGSVSPSPLPSPPPLKVPTPPPLKPPAPSKLTSVPILDSNDNRTTSLPNPKAFYPSAPVTTSNPNLMLVGLIELEGESTALFNVNDLTQRVKLGEEIGSSGWILVSITGTQAEISRQGQLFRLSVGENF